MKESRFKLPAMAASSSAIVGLGVGFVEDIKAALNFSLELGFGFICTALIGQELIEEQLRGQEFPNKPFPWCDLAMAPCLWRKAVIGVISNLNEYLCDDRDPAVTRRAVDIIKQQLDYCHHLGLAAAVIELPNKTDFTILANIVSSKLITLQRFQNYWIRLPLFYLEESSNGDGDQSVRQDSWNRWHQFRTLCDYNRQVSPALEISADLPDDEVIERWLGEPVKAIFLSTHIFLSNEDNFPVLSKAHQYVVKKFLNMNCQVIVEGDSPKPDLKFHQQYIRFLSSKEETAPGDPGEGMAEFSAGYEDFLQIPLQPLRDHLESGTYDVFEKDAKKYALYEEAIYFALKDRANLQNDKIVIMVVGAGRGPLVHRSIAAAEKARVNIHVHAVEKNENAIHTLLHLRNGVWGINRVTVVHADMRAYNSPVLADIMISELLGSWGDNELAPECLDGAQRFLKPDGIMIPKSYTSFIAPLMSIKYYQDIGQTLPEKATHKFANFETPYIIHMRNKYIFDLPQQLFSFKHPNRDSSHSNDRYEARTFTVPQDCVLTGFVGYFESVLYGSVSMSICPSNHSEGMFSWFPLLLPIRNPVYIRKNDTILAHFWRKSSASAVWYEWTVTSPKPMAIHNPNGRGCMMDL